MHSDFGTTKIKICHSFPCVLIYLISNTLAISCEELTQWKRLWCWEGLGAGGEGDDRGWDGWMASLTRWMWVWVNSRSWWWTGSLACCNSWGHKELDMTEWLNWTELMGLDDMIVVYWMLRFKPAFLISSQQGALIPILSVICMSEFIDISPRNFDSSLCFQSDILHDILCM